MRTQILKLKDAGKHSIVDICQAIADGYPDVECSVLQIEDAEVGVLIANTTSGRVAIHSVFFV